MEKNRPNTFACIRILYPRSSVVPLNFYLHATCIEIPQNDSEFCKVSDARQYPATWHLSRVAAKEFAFTSPSSIDIIGNKTSNFASPLLGYGRKVIASIRVDSVDERKWREWRKIFFPRLVPVRISAGLRRSSLRLTRHATTYTVSKTSVDY